MLTLQARLDHIVAEMLQKGITLDEAMTEFERRYIARALESARGCKTDAARLLGVHRNTLASKIDNHHVEARPKRKGPRRRVRSA